MIARIRLIITALVACHLFLQPALLTSQLRPSDQQQNAGLNAAPPNVSGPNSMFLGRIEDVTFSGSGEPVPQSSPQPTTSSAQGVSVRTDGGQEDTKTEKIIQQEVQNNTEQDLGPQRPATNVPLGRNEVLIRGDEQEKNQDIYNVRGHVEIRFGTNTLHADQVVYDATTGKMTATGHVVFDGGPHNEHLVGSRATYDISHDTGEFYDVTGSTGVRVKNKTMFLTSSTPFFFTGTVVDKLGPDHYRVHHGFVTSCQLPRPKWRLDSKTADVEIGDDAKLHHATLKMGGIPVFYFPYMEHPVDNLGRKSGFLIPEIGQSNTRGFIFGDGFYWAISRNTDATIGAYLYSNVGWAETGNFRAIGYGYALQAQYYGVVNTQGFRSGGQDPAGEEFKINGFKQLPYGFQGVVSVDYLSSYIFRLTFALGYTEAITAEARSYGFLAKNWNGFAVGVLASTYQNYQSTAPNDFIRISHTPTLEFSSVERPFSRSDFVYAFDIAAEGVSRDEIGFSTAPVVGRVDANPHIAWPKVFNGWTFRPQIGARETYYSQRLATSANAVIGTVVSDPINRNVANASLEVRPPTLAKVFDHKPFGRVLKHTIEPYAIYRYQTGINDFSQIIRFDFRDILADTNEVEYGVVNRLYSKKTKINPKCYQHPENSGASENLSAAATRAQEQSCIDKSPTATNVISWEIAQKYFANTTFGGALVPGRRNVFDTTVDFTGIAFLTEPRLFSPIISRLRAQSGAADFQWDLDYDPVLHQVNASTIFAGYRWGKWYFNGGQSYVNAPGEFTIVNGVQTPDVYDQFRAGLIYGGMSKTGLSAGASIGFSAYSPVVQAATIQTNYNWDCCGVTFEYARWAFGPIRNENAYRFTFSLTNVGSFGSIRRLQRIY